MRPKINRWGQVAANYSSTLRNPTPADFSTLTDACLTALILHEKDILVSFGYTFKFPETFPRGILMSKEDDGSNVRRVKARKLLSWLHEEGYTAATPENLILQRRAFAEFENRIDNLFSDNSH